jgi:hypothetical protein
VPARTWSRYHTDCWWRCWYHDSMAATQKLTVEVPTDLLRRARKSTGEGVSATVRKGLELVAARRAYEELRSLRGKVRLSLKVDELRQDRR